MGIDTFKNAPERNFDTQMKRIRQPGRSTGTGNAGKASNNTNPDDFKRCVPPTSKKITAQNTEMALNSHSDRTAISSFLENSPIGLTDFPDSQSIETMGYRAVFITDNQDDSRTYESNDGGKITVYNGNENVYPQMYEDKKRIIYQNGSYRQEMFYDKDEKLTGGQILIKDGVTAPTEVQFDFDIKNNKISDIISFRRD